jgi:hypothetical protein
VKTKGFKKLASFRLFCVFSGQLFVFLDRIDKIEHDFLKVIYKSWQAPPRQLGLIKKPLSLG